MSSFSWNCQGLGLPRKVQFLKDMVWQYKPNFIFLCETISKKESMERIRTLLGYDGMVVVEPDGRSGGLALLWKTSSEATLISFSQNHIEVQTNIDDMLPWRLTGI